MPIKDLVYVWSEDGRILYRMNPDKGLVEALDLKEIGFGDLYIRRNFTRTFAIKDETTFWFGFGPEVVEISLMKAQWHRVDVSLTYLPA